MDEVIWQEHTFVIEKAPGLGFGIAISGGRDNPGVQSGDPSIIISDVVRQGPANDKLKINDIVTRVNGKPMFNMEHRQAVKELKNSGQRVELTIKRKVMVRVSTPPPGPLSRSRSRDFDSLPRHRSRSRDYDRGRYRSRSRSRDLDDDRRRHRSRSRDLDSRDRRRPRKRSRSRSRTPPRRGRSYSRSPSYSRRSYSRGSSPSYRRGRSRSRTRSRTPPRRRSRSRPRSRSPSFSASSRSFSPPRRDSPPPRMEKHKSVEDLRADISPLSPDPDSAVADGDMMVFPVKTREPKTVVLKKTRWNNSYGLKLGTRIFIQDIQPGSLADKSTEISAGDTILMINGRNVDNKSVNEAIQVIGLSKDKVTMLVKKEDGGTVSLPASRFNSSPPTKKRDDSFSEVESRHSRTRHSRSRKSSTSKESIKIEETHLSSEPPKVAAKPEKKFGGIQVLPSGSAARPSRSSSSSSSSARDTPEPAPRSKEVVHREYSLPPGPSEQDGPILPPTARQILFVKDKSVGIRLAGGNDVGIFVASVQEGTPAARQGLRMGDHILSVNSVNFRNIIREEAVLTLMGLPPGEEVRIIAQPQPEVYKKILEHGTGDSFYIRTHFKYDKSGAHEMSFRQGSAFRISDTLYQGMVGYWLAARIGRNNMEMERGVIPNSSRAEQLKMVQDKKKTQMRDRNSRGISRRLIKNQKQDVPATSASAMFPAYERVVLREAGFKRPTVIFGPLADIARERLAGDYPNMYQVARNEGTVSGQKSNRKGVIRLNTIKDIIEMDKHAILDITPAAVEKLNYAQLYPIVVFLESPSKGAVKEIRQKLAATEEEKKKKAGKLYDRANKLHRGYNHVFTDTIRLTAANDDWYRKLHSTIKDQQSMPVWVSEDKLGGTPEEAEEGVTVPGDDDQFSYVSAPASDYSVTTVGSDFNNSRISDEDGDTDSRDARNVARPKAPASTSSEEDAGNKFDDDDFGDALNPSDDEPPPPVDKPVLPPPAENPEPLRAPFKDKKLTHQPQRAPSTSSSSSSEDEPPIPTITPKPPQGRVITKVEPPRGKQEIPEGRFDPKSFLKSHIRGLKSVGSQDDPEPPPPAVEHHYRDEPPAPLAKSMPAYSQPPPSERPPVSKPEPQQPVYSQVTKRPKPQEDQGMPRDRRETSVRDYAGEIDSFISHDSYNRPNARPQDGRRSPIREEPSRHVPPPQPKPTTSYNRFAGSTQAKPYQPYNPSAKPAYQRPPVTNGVQQKSKFQQEQYKDYMGQIKPAQASSSYNNPRPYSKPAPKFNNGMPSKDHMYDSGVETYDSAKPKKDPVPVSPSTIDEDDPQVVATARGVFDSNGGVLSSVETGVSIVIPKGAIRPGVRQEIYFKVCRDNTALPPLDKNKGETLLSPLVMCGPHGLQFEHPVELRLPHCEPSQWQNVNVPSESNNYEVGSNSVSVLIDHF